MELPLTKKSLSSLYWALVFVLGVLMIYGVVKARKHVEIWQKSVQSAHSQVNVFESGIEIRNG